MAHLALAVLASLALWLAALRVAEGAPNADVAAAFPLAVLIATSFGSLAAIAAARWGTGGRAPIWTARRAVALDAVSLGVSALWLLVLGFGPWTRDLGGISVVCITALRLAPGALAVASMRAPAWLAFVVALGAYAALAVWLPAASLPLGDQVLYLLGAERLRLGSLDARIDPNLFRDLVTFLPGPDNIGTGVATTPLGPRSIQGYAVQLVLLPGWAMAGRIGAQLTMALVTAWASYQTFLILRDLSTRRGWSGSAGATPLLPREVAGWTWILASFTAPLASVATHIYPNALSAAVLATAFRLGFTAEIRRPAPAAGVLALTLFLTPRDGLVLLVLLPFLLAVRADRARVAVAAGAVALAAAAVGGLIYGLPVPFAGYTFGISQAQTLTQESSITARFWVNLPAILFDRTFGLAGTAPWVFIGLLGLVPLLRLERASHRDPVPPILLPAALVIGLSLVVLSFVRLWEGGYAPPNRYFGGLLPLWVPFVALGLAIASGRMRIERRGELMDPAPAGWTLRAIAAVAILMSVAATVILAGIPTTALNSAFEHKVRDAIAGFFVLDPLGWLPSFQPTTPDWAVSAYLRLVPTLAIAAGLAWAGWRVARILVMGGAPSQPPEMASARLMRRR